MAASNERQSILQERPSLLPKAKNEVRQAVVIEDDLRFPVDPALLEKNKRYFPAFLLPHQQIMIQVPIVYKAIF